MEIVPSQTQRKHEALSRVTFSRDLMDSLHHELLAVAIE